MPQSEDEDRYIRDPWPTYPGNEEYDGKSLLSLVHDGKNPFTWDVKVLLEETERHVGCTVQDIPLVSKGSNNYGFHMTLSGKRDIVVRLSRSDLNMPKYDASPLTFITMETTFEADVYALLAAHPEIPVSRLLYYRLPRLHPARPIEPNNISGRRLMVFERAGGKNNVWYELTREGKTKLLLQAAHIRAALFNMRLPDDFTRVWLLPRIMDFMPKDLPLPIAPTRAFWIAMFQARIKATIRNEGDRIGWEEDNYVVGPASLKAKHALLDLIPHILPGGPEEGELYRLVLDHGDFGIHNMSIEAEDEVTRTPHITSLFDWETGCIVPAILSDPEMALQFDLTTDENGGPALKRLREGELPEVEGEYMAYADEYLKALFQQAPFFKQAIQAGRDARHLWSTLKNWSGDDPEEYFGELGAWATRKLKEIECCETK